MMMAILKSLIIYVLLHIIINISNCKRFFKFFLFGYDFQILI